MCVAFSFLSFWHSRVELEKQFTDTNVNVTERGRNGERYDKYDGQENVTGKKYKIMMWRKEKHDSGYRKLIHLCSKKDRFFFFK
jgi:hypothetical protein